MPFIITWPGKIPAGKIDNVSEVNAIDILPSLAKITGIRLPEGYKGVDLDRSMVPVNHRFVKRQCSG